MSIARGRPQEERGSGLCGQGKGGQKPEFLVDIINGWPLTLGSLFWPLEPNNSLV